MEVISMFKWGKKSNRNRETLSPDLRTIADKVLSYNLMDCMIDCSYRNDSEQDRLYAIHRSKVKWPKSKHNQLPSLAMDLVPIINGKASWNKLHCCFLAGLVQATAKELEVKLRWGGNWDMDHEPITDQDFQDLAHFEEVD